MSEGELDRFVAEVAGRLGLALDPASGAAGIAATLRDRLQATGAAGVAEYLERITPAEVSALAERLTVGETYFFRYKEQFDALAEALPGLSSARGGRLRLLSAASSSGEEAGTLAIVLLSTLPDVEARASTILGVDVNPAAIRRARRGRYVEWSLRDTPAPVRARWFEARGKELELRAEARALLTFAEKNLADPDGELWRPEAYDVVFCRNALMYFTEAAAAAVIERIAGALAPGGLLFLGPTETHLARAGGLAVRSSHGAFYHQRVEGSAAGAWRRPTPMPSPKPVAPSPALDLAGAWADDVRSAGDRIAALARRPASAEAAAAAEPPRPSASGGPADLSRALELLRADRVPEALDALPRGDDDPDVLLLRAVLLSSSGDVRGAEEACRAVLSLDALRAGARYLLALCREHAGDAEGAVAHDRAAAYLDPRFAMPHLHLGVLARRRGDAAEAARELRVAAALFAEDDEGHLLLFGGGLGRGALIERCRAELRACGAAT